ncbi:MAG: hypothetical protein OXQ92_16005, partial [Boseongicola sp.]|nr:hypothetical protein [Boseongicola sp.]
TEIAGVPEKYNATLTMGFMSLIAEAKAAHPEKSVDDLIATCAEISSPGALTSKFSAERLNGPLTRSIGLLPDRA